MELRQELQGTSRIRKWANCYNVREDIGIENFVSDVKKRGYLKKSELIEVACWKLPDRWKRGKDEGKLGLVKRNSPDDVRKFTEAAFLSTDDIESLRHLRELDGIGSAIGSAILHWFHEKRYPIWDMHARRSVQLPKDYYSDTRWKAYTEFCRAIAKQYEVDMRTLDRALFLYGKTKC